jgi:nicotinamide-nucleotide adenylyltransferase
MTRCLLVGRFQPFHRGHLAVVRQIRADHPKMAILLGIGSAQESHTLLNPFTAGERFEMIVRTLAAENIGGVVAVPIPDIQRHSVWVAHVRSLLPPFEIVYTNNPLTQMLFHGGGYEVTTPALVERSRFEGRHIRQAMTEGDAWKELVPSAVADCIDEIHGAERVRLLASRGPDVAPEHPP